MIEELYRSILTIMYKYKFFLIKTNGKQIYNIILTINTALYGKFSKEFYRYKEQK